MNAIEHKAGSQERELLEELEQKEWLAAVAEQEKQRDAERVATRVLARERPARAEARGESVLRTEISWRVLVGWVLILGGLVGMGYFLLVFSVGAPGADVVNLGLMNTRMVGAMVAGFCFLAGVVCITQRAQRHKE